MMEIFDVEVCHFYCWTVENGSSLYLVERDPEYWKFIMRVLEEFWERNLVPARELLLASDGEDIQGVEVSRQKPAQSNAQMHILADILADIFV